MQRKVSPAVSLFKSFYNFQRSLSRCAGLFKCNAPLLSFRFFTLLLLFDFQTSSFLAHSFPKLPAIPSSYYRVLAELMSFLDGIQYEVRHDHNQQRLSQITPRIERKQRTRGHHQRPRDEDVNPVAKIPLVITGSESEVYMDPIVD